MTRASAQMPSRDMVLRAEPEIESVTSGPFDLAATQTRAVIDSQIATAKQYPRSIRKFLDDATTMATLTPEIAKSCIYALPRDGKVITGKSVRLAEIVASTYRNVRTMTSIKSEGDRFLVAEAVCIDLENNVGSSTEVRRRITNREGKRFSDDMINTTANAALSIAYRNAVFDVIPGPLVDQVYQAARECAAGNIETIDQNRAAWREWARSKKLKDKEVLDALGVRGWEEVGLEQLEVLAGFQNAIKLGEATIESIFRPKPSEVDHAGQSKSDRIAAEMQAKSETKPTREPGEEG